MVDYLHVTLLNVLMRFVVVESGTRQEPVEKATLNAVQHNNKLYWADFAFEVFGLVNISGEA